MAEENQKLPSLKELLENKTVFVLGAGASMDYGFPNWKQLREGLITELGYFDRRMSIAQDWIRYITDNQDKTLDLMASEMRDANGGDGEWYFRMFQLATGAAIADFEKKDSSWRTGKPAKWIENFADVLADVLLESPEQVKQFADNFSVVTLNYDRCFDIRFFRRLVTSFINNLPNNLQEFEKKYSTEFVPFRRVIHPHGCLGKLSSMVTDHGATKGLSYEVVSLGETYNEYGKDLAQVGYGMPEYFRQLQRNDESKLSIFPVDDLDAPENCVGYNESNRLLAEASNCICIGLSEDGITQSHLEFGNLERVFYSGAKIGTAGYDNFVPLNKKADAIVTDLGSS